MEQDKEELVETAPQPRSSGIREDFSQLFEESLRSVKPGEIVRGRVVKIGPEFVTVDIGYKSEGHIPLACTPEPATAAPITGSVDESKVEFSHHMSVSRLRESPP